MYKYVCMYSTVYSMYSTYNIQLHTYISTIHPVRSIVSKYDMLYIHTVHTLQYIHMLFYRKYADHSIFVSDQGVNGPIITRFRG